MTEVQLTIKDSREIFEDWEEFLLSMFFLIGLSGFCLPSSVTLPTTVFSREQLSEASILLPMREHRAQPLQVQVSLSRDILER